MDFEGWTEDEIADFMTDTQLKAENALAPLLAGLTHVEQAVVWHEVADHAQDRGHAAVAAARGAGATWSDVGEAFGISRQAAQQRFRYAGAR